MLDYSAQRIRVPLSRALSRWGKVHNGVTSRRKWRETHLDRVEPGTVGRGWCGCSGSPLTCASSSQVRRVDASGVAARPICCLGQGPLPGSPVCAVHIEDYPLDALPIPQSAYLPPNVQRSCQQIGKKQRTQGSDRLQGPGRQKARKG